MRTRKSQRLLFVLGIVLGILFLSIYFLSALDGAVFSRLGLWTFAAAQDRSNDRPATAPTNPGENEVSFRLWSAKRIQDYKASLLTKLDLPIAVLSIPRLGLTAPVLEGTDDLTLNRGLGRIVSTAQLGEDGNVGIAGHRDGFFRALKDIDRGDSIEIATSQGHDLYVVDRIDIVDPENVSVLQAGQSAEITLITCYPFYYIGDAPHRYVVHASLKHRIVQLHAQTTPPSNSDMNKEK